MYLAWGFLILLLGCPVVTIVATFALFSVIDYYTETLYVTFDCGNGVETTLIMKPHVEINSVRPILLGKKNLSSNYKVDFFFES